MAGYNYRFSGLKIDGVDMYFEDALFDRLQSALEDLAVATGIIDADKVGGWLLGNFTVALGRDTRNGNDFKLVGMFPHGIVDDDNKAQPTNV